MFGGGMRGQRVQARQRVVARGALQGRGRRCAQRLQFFQQVAAGAGIGVQLLRAFGQPAQPRLHAKRRLHRGLEVEGVTQGRRCGAAHRAPPRGADQTRFLYSLVRVSISILSPVSTNSGTEISSPVASLAGLSTLPEVSPLTAGSV